MSNQSEVLSIAEISRRLSEVRLGERDLRAQLHPDSLNNAVLRTKDILRYLHCDDSEFYKWFPDVPRLHHHLTVNRAKERGKRLPERWQREFSRFFQAWEHGNLVKARVGNEWQIIGRHTPLAKVAPAAGQKAPDRVITMRIDPKTLGLKLS